MMAAGVVLAGGATIATPSMAWALSCDSTEAAGNHICLFNDPNYQGNLSLIGDLGDGYCDNFESEPKRSVRNGQKFEGYLFEGSNCTGRSFPVPFNTENPDIGFVATSFKQTCVSCLPNILGRLLGQPVSR